MAEVIIRKANNNDFEEIQNIGQSHFAEQKETKEPYYNIEWSFSKPGIEYYKNAINKPDKASFVAVIDSKIVGFLNTSSYFDQKLGDLKIAEVDEIIVLPNYRNQGIGSKLMEEFLKWRQKVGAKRMVVKTFALDERAVGFYKKHGFDDFVIELKKDFSDNIA